jgi:methionyl-tRNA formyltransferase
MKIFFLGTPDYALRSLERLAREHEIVGVLAQPDRRIGRHGKTVPPPTATFARERGISLFQPERPRGKSFRREIESLGADLAVVVAYGHILRPWIINVCPHGMINAHGSVLPAYRGAAPIQRAILDDCTATGVTVQKVVLEVDAGPVLLVEKTTIGAEETSGQLFARMAGLSAEALARGVGLIESGKADYAEQDHAAATYARKLTKEEGLADWSRPAEKLARAVRAYNPWPTLYTRLPDGRRLKVLVASAQAGGEKVPTGTIVAAEGADLAVRTGDGVLRLLSVQAEGKRAMDAADFLRGAPLATGDRLGGL